MNKLEIPQTDSIEELARFWDSHDLTDYEDQLEEVTEAFFRPEIEAVSKRSTSVLTNDTSNGTILA